MIAGLRKGNRVTTIGGIYGEIIDIKDDAVLLNIAGQGERTVVRLAKWGSSGCARQRQRRQGTRRQKRRAHSLEGTIEEAST